MTWNSKNLLKMNDQPYPESVLEGQQWLRSCPDRWFSRWIFL